MNNRKTFKRIITMFLSSATVLSFSGSTILFAEEMQEESSYSFEEEASSPASILIDGNSHTQLYPEEDFKLSTNLTIDSASYKTPITSLLNTLDKADSKWKPYSTVTGLDTLTGEIVYTVKSSKPLKSIPGFVLSENTNGAVEIESQTSGNNTDTFSVTLKVHWNDLISGKFDASGDNQKNYIDFFKEADFPNLSIEISSNSSFDFNEPQKVGTYPINFTGTITKCTMNSEAISVTYGRVEKDSLGRLTNNFYTSENKQISTNLATHSLSSASVSIVDKKTRPNHNKPNRPILPSVPTDPSETQNVIRLYNHATGEHLFTSSEAERINLVANGWKVEHCDWSTPTYSDIPIYRVYNPNNGDHHYTTSAGEVSALVSYGWNNEGIVLYSADENTHRAITIYRMYNPNAKGVGSHHYTSSVEECQALQTYGWKFEGEAWMGIKN